MNNCSSYKSNWSKDWTKEEFKEIWQTGNFRQYCKKRKDTNEMVTYYIEKYGEDVPAHINLIRGIQNREKRNRIGNSWHPFNTEPSKLFTINSKYSDGFYLYNSSLLKNKRGIHFDEKGLFEEEWLLNASDIRIDSIYLTRYKAEELLKEGEE